MANITAEMVKELRERTGAGMMDCRNALKESDGDMSKAVDYLREKGLSSAAKKSTRIAAEGLVDARLSEDEKYAVTIEVNSETDFVTKNEEFKKFVSDVADVALSVKPANIDELLAAELNAHTVKDELTDKIAKIGENLSVRRVDSLSVENGLVSTYIHGGANIASLVAVESDSDDKAALSELGKDIAMQVAAMGAKFLNIEDVNKEYVDHEREVLTAQALNENDELPEDKRKPVEIVQKMVEGRLTKELKEVCLMEQAFVKENKKSVKDVVAEYAKKLGKNVNIKGFVRYEVGEGLEKREDDFAEEVARQMQG